MKALKRILCTLLMLSSATVLRAADYTPTKENIRAREEFSRMRFGVFIHWGIYSMRGRGEWTLQTDRLLQSEYSRLASGFCPSKFDAAQWARTLRESGARYVCFTSRHHDGFSMYHTKLSSYNIVDGSPMGRDVMKELSEALLREGLMFNVYYSTLDWGREDYFPRGRTGLETGRADGKPGDWDHYHLFMRGQLREILSGYGPIGAIWLDGVWDMDAEPREKQPELWQMERMYSLIHSLQPSCLIGNNHHLDIFPGEDIQIFERDIPGHNEAGYSSQQISRLPLETCQTMNHSWGYRMDDDDYKSWQQCTEYLVRTAAKGANLLLNVGPRADGTLPEKAQEILKKMGQWLGRYGESIYSTQAGFTGEQSWGVSTMRHKTLYAHVLSEEESITISIPKGNGIRRAYCMDSDKKCTLCIEGRKATIRFERKGAQEPDRIICIEFSGRLEQ